MIDTLKNWTLEQFAHENEIGVKAYRGSEWKPYDLAAIKKWISIRDNYTYTDGYSPGTWEALDIKTSHSKYGTNYIYLDHERKLWRIYETISEFYGDGPVYD